MIILHTYPAGEKAQDGGEYGFWTTYSPEEGAIRRTHNTTAGFRYCGGCASFGDIFGPCAACQDEDIDGTIITLEDAVKELTNETGCAVTAHLITEDLQTEELVNYTSRQYLAALR